MSLTATADPPFSNLARQANRLLDQLQKGYSNFYPGEQWRPNVNLYETEAAYLVCVDLAGVDKSKIDIELIDGKLKIRGDRAVPTPESEAETDSAPAPDSDRQGKIRVHLMEIDYGSFAREVELPLGVDRDRISAVHRNGILWIEIPKKPD